MDDRMGYEYRPDYASSPGEVLKEVLDVRQIPEKEFADRCGLSTRHVYQVMNGKASVTPDVAILFERVLGIDSYIWNNLESRYRSFQAQATARENTRKLLEWAKEFPVKELVKRGIIEPPKGTEQVVESLFKFFGVASREAWDSKYGLMTMSCRLSTSLESKQALLATWLRQGEILADRIDTLPYNRNRFLEILSPVRSLTLQPQEVYVSKLKELCVQAGVAVLFVREFHSTHVSAAARWLHPSKALIQMSFRHKTEDHFWFGFFHEAAHILNGSKKDIFIDNSDSCTEIERRANAFAANFLIPQTKYKKFTDRGVFTEKTVSSFAEELGISPGIVAGRLQQEKKISLNRLNHLKKAMILDLDG